MKEASCFFPKHELHIKLNKLLKIYISSSCTDVEPETVEKCTVENPLRRV